MMPKYLQVEYINNNVAKIFDQKVVPILEEMEAMKLSNDHKFV
jgi:hypothetical protein